MLELTTEVELVAPAGKVWAVLTAFGSYPSWHPWLRISGAAGSGETIRYSFDPAMNGRTLTMDAEIEEWQHPVSLAWAFGFPGVFTLQERFLLHRSARGTRMQHSIKCRGIAALLLGRFMTRKIEALLTSSDGALAAHLAKRRPASPKGALQRSGTGGKQRRKGGPRARR